MDDGVYRDAQKYGSQNSDKSCSEADDDGLGVKYARDILLRSTDSAQNADLFRKTAAQYFDNADLFRTLKDADIGYDADHNARNNKAYSNKCYENIGYDVDYRSHRAHYKRYIVGVVYLIFGVDCRVVVLNHLGDGILCGECCNVDVNAGR